jgi:catechol 2,3-dioxygenase-like lactoylglutathione lyase family enzyme
MIITELNHVALHVKDVLASIAFYRDVVGLTQLPRPEFTFQGAWFALGPYQELHLIEGREMATQDDNRGNHFAVCVEDFDQVAKYFVQLKLVCKGPTVRPDGAKQVFIKDPDGHVFEFCNNDGAKARDRSLDN